MTKRKFSELSRRSRRIIVGAGIVEMILLVTAQVDLARRPASQVRGPKSRWRLLAFINFFGPLAYFRWGRRPAGDDAAVCDQSR